MPELTNNEVKIRYDKVKGLADHLREAILVWNKTEKADLTTMEVGHSFLLLMFNEGEMAGAENSIVMAFLNHAEPETETKTSAGITPGNA